ncbi:MAG: radical SAM protein [SAR202 cluster bacterium]|nr:radical SAM protein [SAR202 cluster bacterium]
MATPLNKGPRDYNQETLLNDSSMRWKGFDREALLAAVRQENADQPITALRHPEVRYEVTDHCNAECIMCPRDLHKFGRPHGIMDRAKYEKSIDEVVALGCKQVVLTSFGEPLVDKGLETKIAYAKSKGLRTYIISNASLLTHDRAKGLIEAGLDEMRVSYYGMRKESYEKVMVGLNFDVTMKNLAGFLELRAQMGSKRPRLELSWLVLPENAEDTDAFKKYWEPRADAIEIWKPHNFGDGRDYRERYEEIAMKNTCGRPENGPLQIQWNGEVIPCCYDYNNQIVLGNAFEQSVLEILNNDKHRLLRLAHREKRFEMFPYCNQCDQLLPHTEALVYTNRHNLPKEVAVKMSNTDLYNLVDDEAFDTANFSERYSDGLVEADPAP